MGIVMEDFNEKVVRESVCPSCGGVLLVKEWWDDTEENGGAYIGEIYDCTECDYYETE